MKGIKMQTSNINFTGILKYKVPALYGKTRNAYLDTSKVTGWEDNRYGEHCYDNASNGVNVSLGGTVKTIEGLTADEFAQIMDRANAPENEGKTIELTNLEDRWKDFWHYSSGIDSKKADQIIDVKTLNGYDTLQVRNR